MEIKDRDERDAAIADYLAVKQAIKDRNLEERSAGMTRKQELEETFAPLVAANADMTLGKMFGIRYESGIPWIGNQVISINNDDITVNGKVYEGTPDLWSLITDTNPKVLKTI